MKIIAAIVFGLFTIIFYNMYAKREGYWCYGGAACVGLLVSLAFY